MGARRATEEERLRWAAEGRVDLYEHELAIEQAWADELERRGRWAR